MVDAVTFKLTGLYDVGVALIAGQLPAPFATAVHAILVVPVAPCPTALKLQVFDSALLDKQQLPTGRLF